MQSLRIKLIGVYSVITIMLLFTFSHWINTDTKQWFFNGIDKSLQFSAKSIDEFLMDIDIDLIDSLHSDNYQTDYLKQVNGSISLMMRIYESMIFNPQKYYIQITDLKHNQIWKSKNLQDLYLPTFPDESELKVLKTYTETIYDYDTIPRFIYRRSLRGQPGDTVFTKIPFSDGDLRLFIMRSDNYVISIGYSLSAVTFIMERFESYFLFGIPVIILFLVSILLLLSNSIYTPLKNLTTQINKLGDGFDHTLTAGDSNIEITELTDSLNNCLDKISNKIVKTNNFAYDAAHELKTPLTILRGELELALSNCRSLDDYQKVIASNLDEVIRLTNVVETLLELTRADNGKIKMNFIETDISALLNDIMQDIEILAEDKSINVKSDIEKNVNFAIDSNRIYQALLNILENSIKYNKAGGEIYLKMNLLDNKLYITIEDTGIGMNDECIEKIFNRFYRDNSVNNSHIQGTGLGLSIVKWIIDAHNGQIKVESKPSVGSKFVIILPENKDE